MSSTKWVLSIFSAHSEGVLIQHKITIQLNCTMLKAMSACVHTSIVLIIKKGVVAQLLRVWLDTCTLY